MQTMNNNKEINLLANMSYEDCLLKIKMLLSSLVVVDYSYFVDNTLKDALKAFQSKYGDSHISDLRNDDILSLLFEASDNCEFSSKLLQINQLSLAVIRRTASALSDLQTHIFKIVRLVRQIFCELAGQEGEKFFSGNPVDFLRGDIQRFYSDIRHNLSKLMEPMFPRSLGAISEPEAGEMLASEYEKWLLIDSSKQPEGYIWMFLQHAVISNGKFNRLYDKVIDSLLDKEDLGLIDKITRIYGDIQDVTSNVEKRLKSNGGKAVTVSPDVKDKVKLLAVLIRNATEKCQIAVNDSNFTGSPPRANGGNSNSADDGGAKRGRKRKYTDKRLMEMQRCFDKLYPKKYDSKSAWNKVAEKHDAPSGNAARQACQNYRKRQNSEQI